mmetsp:Transcript_9332/g.26830  ORF Transcript_9332/g.26830 Transcript_9332/m.26830 type:complete len:322 (-) Transcript_9332:1440-2405(-)
MQVQHRQDGPELQRYSVHRGRRAGLVFVEPGQGACALQLQPLRHLPAGLRRDHPPGGPDQARGAAKGRRQVLCRHPGPDLRDGPCGGRVLRASEAHHPRPRHLPRHRHQLATARRGRSRLGIGGGGRAGDGELLRQHEQPGPGPQALGDAGVGHGQDGVIPGALRWRGPGRHGAAPGGRDSVAGAREAHDDRHAEQLPPRPGELAEAGARARGRPLLPLRGVTERTAPDEQRPEHPQRPRRHAAELRHGHSAQPHPGGPHSEEGHPGGLGRRWRLLPLRLRLHRAGPVGEEEGGDPQLLCGDGDLDHRQEDAEGQRLHPRA